MFFQQFSYTRELHQTFLVYLLSSKRPISELIRPNLLSIKSLDDNQFEGMTSLDIDCKTLEGTRTQIFDMVLSSMTDQDKEFLLSFKRGEPKWDLLPIEKAQLFPSVKWKLHNIRAMSAIKRQQSLGVLEEKLGV